MKKQKRSQTKAFTLIELIVVIAIIAILILLGSGLYKGYTKEAELTKHMTYVKELEAASERYYMKEGKWPRASETPYTADQIEEYSERIRDLTGEEISLEEGNYYNIAYDDLAKYTKIPTDRNNYILQNPVGRVYYLENLTEIGEDRLVPEKEAPIITMTPNKGIKPSTVISWDYTFEEGSGLDAEWENKKATYEAGTHTVKVRVKDEKGKWTAWGEIEFTVDVTITNPALPGVFTPSTGTLNRDNYHNITWTKVTNWGLPLRGMNYRLEYRYNKTGEFIFLADTGQDNTYEYFIPESSDNTTLEFRVRAENDQAFSAWRTSSYSLTSSSLINFTNTGNVVSTYKVPHDGEYMITTNGAQGGSGGSNYSNNWGGGVKQGGSAGKAGTMNKGVFNLKAGDILYIYQGVSGTSGTNGYNETGSISKGGYGGGGGGGGSSYVTLNENNVGSIIISAKGGNGGSGGYEGTSSRGYGTPGTGGQSGTGGVGSSGSTYNGGSGGGQNINTGENTTTGTSANQGKVTIEKYFK